MIMIIMLAQPFFLFFQVKQMHHNVFRRHRNVTMCEYHNRILAMNMNENQLESNLILSNSYAE